MNLRFALRSFGIPVTEPTRIIGDNMSVIQNSTQPDAEVKKKHVSISFHLTREAIAAGVTEPWWICSEENISDVLTKTLTRDLHDRHCITLFYYSKGRNSISERLSSDLRHS